MGNLQLNSAFGSARQQLLIILLASSTIWPISAQLQLPVYRLPFVSPGDAALSVSSYQVFKQSGIFSLVNNSLKTGRPDAAYCIQLIVGTPGQKLTAILDTGSADCVISGTSAPSLSRWFRAGQSSSLSWLQQLVRRPYTAGFWEGHLATDLVTVTDVSGRAVSPQFSAVFTVAERSSEFFDRGGGGVWQSSVGLAFNMLASAQTAAPEGTSFSDALGKRIGETATPTVFAMQLCTGDAGSFISVGRGNRTGMLYAAIRYGWYYEVVIADVRLNDFTLGMDCKEFNFEQAIVHSGIGDIRLPPRVHSRISQQLGNQMPQLGNQFFNGVSLMCSTGGDANATGELLRAFPFITFSLVSSPNETVDLSLSPAQYLRQVETNGAAGNRSCFRFSMVKSSSGTVLGSSFISGFQVEFDRQRKRIGFSQSGCSSGGSSGPPPSRVSRGPPLSQRSGDPWGGCAFFRADPEGSASVVRPGAIALATVCVACVLPVCALLLWKQLRRQKRDDEAGETVQLVQG